MRDITDYTKLSPDVLRAKIAAVRAKAGDRLAILAHYYVPDEVVEIADYVGDSLGLAKKAAASPADTVLFCGVKFMLETADVLMNRPEKIAARGGRRAVVMAPDITAGCPMADMITPEQAERLGKGEPLPWLELSQIVQGLQAALDFFGEKREA